MKKNIVLIAEIALVAVLVVLIFMKPIKNIDRPPNSALCDTLSQRTDKLSREDTIVALAASFALQESNMNHKAVSPHGKHVGCLQISKVCVAEANRILGGQLFYDGSEGYIDDRLDRQGSYAIFKTIQLHYNPELDVDKAVDIWNKKAPNIYRDNIKRNYYKALIDKELRDYFK